MDCQFFPLRCEQVLECSSVGLFTTITSLNRVVNSAQREAAQDQFRFQVTTEGRVNILTFSVTVCLISTETKTPEHVSAPAAFMQLPTRTQSGGALSLEPAADCICSVLTDTAAAAVPVQTSEMLAC